MNTYLSLYFIILSLSCFNSHIIYLGQNLSISQTGSESNPYSSIKTTLKRIEEFSSNNEIKEINILDSYFENDLNDVKIEFKQISLTI